MGKLKAFFSKIGHYSLAALEKLWFVITLFFHKVFITLPPRAWKATTAGLWRLGFNIYIRSRYYRNWSKLYQWLYERKYANTPIATYATLAALHDVINTCTWVQDGLKELGDAFSTAGYIQNVINQGGARKIGDCDEFAMYNSTAIADSIKAGVWKDRAIKDTQIMTLCWKDAKTGGWNGHNVCVILWADGKFSYVDYNSPSNEAASIHDVALQVVSDYGGDMAIGLLGWAVYDRNLDVLSCNWK
jgi:hypothetical protein